MDVDRMNRVEYSTENGVIGKVSVNGKPVRVRSIKIEHSVDEAALVTLELIAPEVHVTALTDVVYRKVTFRSLIHDLFTLIRSKRR